MESEEIKEGQVWVNTGSGHPSDVTRVGTLYVELASRVTGRRRTALRSTLLKSYRLWERG